jgi:hypothetical protein
MLSSSSCTHLLVVLLLVSLECGLGDTVQITLTGLCDTTATLVLILLEHTDLLESLHNLAVDGAGGIDMVGGARTAVLGGTVRYQYLLRDEYGVERSYPWALRRRPTPTV